ncbi:hypothetical protein F5877DRAFT_65618 [Lentinula edodes]|nr:hypothetical protein F5877DRAFT_65618 [Lentinula edodes]
MFVLHYGVAVMAGYMIATVHALPASLSSRSLRFTSQTKNTGEPKWLIQTPYPELEAKDRKAFFSKLILGSSSASHGGQHAISTPKLIPISNPSLLAIQHITQYNDHSGNVIVNFLLQKTPTDSDYAKVKVLKEIDDVPLEKVNLSNAQKKQVNGQIGKLVCGKVVEVAEKYQILYMGFEATDILVAFSDPSAHLTSRSILSSSRDSTSSPMVESVDLLGWDKVKKITKGASKDEVCPLLHLIIYYMQPIPSTLQASIIPKLVLSSFIRNNINWFLILLWDLLQNRSQEIENPQCGIVIEWKTPTSGRSKTAAENYLNTGFQLHDGFRRFSNITARIFQAKHMISSRPGALPSSTRSNACGIGSSEVHIWLIRLETKNQSEKQQVRLALFTSIVTYCNAQSKPKSITTYYYQRISVEWRHSHRLDLDPVTMITLKAGEILGWVKSRLTYNKFNGLGTGTGRRDIRGGRDWQAASIT